MNAKFTDQTIAQISKCLQLAILTGTDIVDHLRQLQFVIIDGNIEVSSEYTAQFEANIEKMLLELQETQTTKKRTLFD